MNKKQFVVSVCLFLCICVNAQQAIVADSLLNNAMNSTWERVFYDDCRTNWQLKWTKDGETSSVVNTLRGMELRAGSFNLPVRSPIDADHTVLWTKQSFDGSLRIEYDYTRLDTINKFVTILYLFAEGSGVGPYAQDISTWDSLRRIPAMDEYFDHMNTYHISYSAYDTAGNEYVRARRYVPEYKGLNGTALANEYLDTGLFKTGVKYHITIFSTQSHIIMKVDEIACGSNGNDGKLVLPKNAIFYWDKAGHKPQTRGRIGLRMMYHRGAIFNNFEVYKAK